MQIAFALLADAANISQEGKLNIMGVFDAVQVASFPSLHPRAHLVMRLQGTPQDVGQHTVTLRWINPAGNELFSSIGEMNVAPPPSGIVEMDFPLIAALDLPIDQSGSFRLNITLDEQLSTDLRLYVRGNAPIMPASGMMS